MQNVLDSGKRALSAAVAAATIALSVSTGVLLNPGTTHAAAAGDVFKGTSLTTAYYYGYDGQRYAFPSENVYKSWYMTSSGGADFSGVITMSDSAVAQLTLGGNVVVRPGTYWIKVTSSNKVYAVARNGKIHWIETPEVAEAFRGSDWNSTATTIDIPDVFFTDYTEGTSLMDATAFEGMTYMMGGETYIVWDGEMRRVTSAGMSANRLMSKFVMDGSGVNDGALSEGDDVSSKSAAISDTAQMVEDEVVSEGDVTVSGSSSMPVGVSVPKGANAVEVFRFNVKAGGEDAVVDGLALTLTGAGQTGDISAVYLYEGDNRLTESRTVNSSTRQVTFSNLDLALDAGETRTLTARVTISGSATSADQIGFKIADKSDVVAGGNVGGSFPVSGNYFTITGSSVGSLTVTKTGTISSPTLGQNDAKIGQFKTTADGSEGASIESITLKIDNAGDHDDFRLWDGTELLAVGENISGDWVVFDLSDEPFDIEEGGNNIFTVSADIGGQAGDSVKVYVDNEIDVVAVGSDYGFGLTVDTNDDGNYDGASCTSSSGSCSYSEIQGGDVTFAFDGPSAGDIQTDAQDQTLLAFSVTASEEVTIKDLDIIVAADDDGDGDTADGAEDNTSNDDDGLINSGNEANLKDIKIVNADTGKVVWSPQELDTASDDTTQESSTSGSAEDALQIIDFTDDLTLDAGETLNLEVRADIDNALTSGETIVAELDISGLNIEDKNGDALSSSDIVPGSDIVGYAQTARASSLAFTLASTPGDTTTVDGTDNVNVVSFAVTAGNASDVRITDFILTAYGDDDNSGTFSAGGQTVSDINDYVDSCSLYEGSTLLAGPEAPAANGQTFDFDNIDWTVDSGEVTTLLVKCNFANTSASGNAYFSFDINNVTTDVIAEDEDGDELSASSLSGSDVNGAGAAPVNVVTLADSGTLAVTIGAEMPSADFVMTSSTNNLVSVYRFAASNEAFDVKTLTFSEEQGEDDTGVADSSAYANNISLVTISYPKADGTTGTKTAPMSGNEARFNDLDMQVVVGSPKEVKVYVNVPLTDRDSGGSATSNEKLRMGLFVDLTNDDNFKAVGAGSGETKDDDMFDANSNGTIETAELAGDDSFTTDGVATFVVRETKPTLSVSSSSPSGTVVAGRAEVFRFNVAASSNEDVVLSKLMFKITATDKGGSGWNDCDTDGGVTAASDFDLYNLTVDGTNQALDTSDANWSLYKATGAICDATAADLTFVRITLPTVEIIPKGTSQTFALYFDSTGANDDPIDSLRIDMPSDPIVAQSGFLTASDLNENNLAPTDTTLTVTSSAGYVVGDVLSMDTGDNGSASGDELMLLTQITNGTTIEVVRGYLNTAPDITNANDVADDIDRMPSALLWQDDGSASIEDRNNDSSTADDSVKEYYGAYLVKSLQLSGNTLLLQ